MAREVFLLLQEINEDLNEVKNKTKTTMPRLLVLVCKPICSIAKSEGSNLFTFN